MTFRSGRAPAEQDAIRRLTDWLARQFPDLSATDVERAVYGNHSSVDDGPIREFVPVLPTKPAASSWPVNTRASTARRDGRAAGVGADGVNHPAIAAPLGAITEALVSAAAEAHETGIPWSSRTLHLDVAVSRCFAAAETLSDIRHALAIRQEVTRGLAKVTPWSGRHRGSEVGISRRARIQKLDRCGGDLLVPSATGPERGAARAVGGGIRPARAHCRAGWIRHAGRV